MIHPIKHFITITKHRHKVIAHTFRCGIGLQGLCHDLSKYSPTEFIPGARYYTGNRSPNEGERAEYGYSAAWLHHKGRNRHHYEYWYDIDPQKKIYVPVEMPVRYLKEMFCDRVAASKIYHKNDYDNSYPYNYFIKSNAKNLMHERTAATLEKWLIMLRDEGEKKTFAYIKHIPNREKRKSKAGSDWSREI